MNRGGHFAAIERPEELAAEDPLVLQTASRKLITTTARNDPHEAPVSSIGRREGPPRLLERM